MGVWQNFKMISKRYKTRFILSAFLLSACLFVSSAGAQTQNTIDVRASNNKDYSRLVFDGKSSGDYSVKKENDSLIVSFKKATQANVNTTSDIKNIGTIAVLSGQGEPLEVSVAIPSDSKYRHFKIGKRVVFDVYNTKNQPSRTPALNAQKQTPVDTSNKISLENKNSEDTPASPSQASLSGKANVITISATKSVGLAVFKRGGYLWIVQDDPSVTVPPSIAGPDKGKLGEFEELTINSGKAYRLPIDNQTNVYAEGGGLLWRIVLTQNPRNKRPLTMETKEVDGVNGGATRSLYWPLKSARKSVNLKDPFVGDDIHIVTAADSAQIIGPVREFSQMKVLESIVGLAVVPYIDNLDVRAVVGGASVSSAEGLAVSPASETKSLTLQDDIEKENQFFEEKENPRTMSRVFDFTRWEMGGSRSLDENRRILMVGMAGKQGSARVEDLITLAKLNVANDRGAEALGLLRVAESQLPGIEESPEFKAIRGAAATLAMKYDEAIEDLVHSSLDRYDEIDYWRAAALAGLEDWQQADKMAPSQLHVLEKYPAKVQQPIALAMTEVALRAGKLGVAESLLTMLQPDYETMTLGRQSAWKYLQGEFERQSDNPEQALKNWEQLLTGKDNYYRAKAGLSVTRMQLERKKITTEKAIDRLEGLRYAWRGDELETLINFRLGETYINSEDYLKGLTVLRNAVGISPNSKISDEVTEYMTRKFRDLFTDGSLNDISPLDAVTIYDEFKELTPAGEEGDVFVQNLAERLLKVDLLNRAASLLEDQMNFRVKGSSRANVAIRLAAAYLLNGKVDEAFNALNIADKTVREFGGSEALKQEIKMLRARAYSQNGEANKALSYLKNLPDTENIAKLRADIAWNGGLWNDAANAFDSLIDHAGISATRPMDEYQENLILNRSIALNLSNNRSGLASVRKKYGDLIKQSSKARIFDLVTRPRQLGVLDDRESVKALISEVDLFGGFLENYKGVN